MAKEILDSSKKSTPISIPGKSTEQPKVSSSPKDVSIKYYDDTDFFIGSPRSGLRLEKFKSCARVYLDSQKDDPLDEPKDPELSGESYIEDEYS